MAFWRDRRLPFSEVGPVLRSALPDWLRFVGTRSRGSGSIGKEGSRILQVSAAIRDRRKRVLFGMIWRNCGPGADIFINSYRRALHAAKACARSAADRS